MFGNKKTQSKQEQKHEEHRDLIQQANVQTQGLKPSTAIQGQPQGNQTSSSSSLFNNMQEIQQLEVKINNMEVFMKEQSNIMTTISMAVENLKETDEERRKSPILTAISDSKRLSTIEQNILKRDIDYAGVVEAIESNSNGINNVVQLMMKFFPKKFEKLQEEQSREAVELTQEDIEEPTKPVKVLELSPD